MASFTRKHYELTFRVAIGAYLEAPIGSALEGEAVGLMWATEDVIGMQTDFPLSARENYPRHFFKGLL